MEAEKEAGQGNFNVCITQAVEGERFFSGEVWGVGSGRPTDGRGCGTGAD